MVSFIRIPFMLVFHQSKCISAIERILFYHPHVYPRVHSCICVFLVIAMYALSLVHCVWE